MLRLQVFPLKLLRKIQRDDYETISAWGWGEETIRGKADWVLSKNGLRACETLGTQQMGVESEHSHASNLI